MLHFFIAEIFLCGMCGWQKNDFGSVFSSVLDDLDVPGVFIISRKTWVSHRPLSGILKLQGVMEQCNGHRL